MIRLESAILVEGKYDKIRLSNIVDAPIFTTDGFRIFKDRRKLDLLRAVARKRGLIILTDSDSAGQFIRSRLKGLIGDENITNVYLPAFKGKEKRKHSPSAEGLLGVEGTDDEILIKALCRFASPPQENERRIEKSDFYAWGLIGYNSTEKRDMLKKRLGLPPAMTANALLESVNILYGYDEFLKILEGI